MTAPLSFRMRYRWSRSRRPCIAVGRNAIDNAVRVIVAVAVDLLAQCQLDVNRAAELGRKHLAHHVAIIVLHPIAEKFIGSFDRRGALFEADKIKRPDPGFVAHAAKSVSHPICSPKPNVIHPRTPPTTDLGDTRQSPASKGLMIRLKLRTGLSTSVDKQYFP